MQSTSRCTTCETFAEKINRIEDNLKKLEKVGLANTIKMKLISAEQEYRSAFNEGRRDQEMWWDGYGRALQHLLDEVG